MDRVDEVRFIGVPNLDSGDDARRVDFIDGIRTPISHILDEPNEVWEEFGVVSQPTMVFVSADGTFERHVGRSDPQDLLERTRLLYGIEKP